MRLIKNRGRELAQGSWYQPAMVVLLTTIRLKRQMALPIVKMGRAFIFFITGGKENGKSRKSRKF